MKRVLMGEGEGIRRAKLHRLLGGGGGIACSDYVVVCVELVWRLDRRWPEELGRLIQVPDVLPTMNHVKSRKWGRRCLSQDHRFTNGEVSTSFAYFPKNRRGTPKSKLQRNANIFLFLSNHAFS
jgi:hypothetical protein